MKKNLLYFLLGVVVTLTMGAATHTLWEETLQQNRYAVDATGSKWEKVNQDCRFVVDTKCDLWKKANQENRFVIDTKGEMWKKANQDCRFVIDTTGAMWKKANPECRFTIAWKDIDVSTSVTNALSEMFVFGYMAGSRHARAMTR